MYIIVQLTKLTEKLSKGLSFALLPWQRCEEFRKERSGAYFLEKIPRRFQITQMINYYCSQEDNLSMHHLTLVFMSNTTLTSHSSTLTSFISRSDTPELTSLSKMAASVDIMLMVTESYETFSEESGHRVIARAPVTNKDRSSVAATIVVTSPTSSRDSIINMAFQKLQQQVKFSFTVNKKLTKVFAKGGNLYAVELNYSRSLLAEL